MLLSIGKNLGGFHHRLARRLAGTRSKWYMTDMWIYPPLDVAITAVGMGEMKTYVVLHLNTIAQYIATHMILELCLV